MAKEKILKVEKEFIIPLREKCRLVARYKKTNKAVKSVKEFIVKHMKIYDRDLKKIKIDRFLNEYLWFRGIKNPPHKVKVKAIKEGDLVRVELAEMPDNLKFKKAREEKREKIAKDILENKPKSLMEKAKGVMQKSKDEKEDLKDEKEDKNKDGIDDKKEESEKKSAVVEAGKVLEDVQAKKQKHTTHSKPVMTKTSSRKVLSRH